jgi:methionyl-tRNA synthetase
MDKKTFYITTTLPYVNADPHVGFAMEIIRADSLARYNSLIGKDVFFNTGTDEHGTKIWEGAKKEGLSIEEYTEKYAQNFKELKDSLNLFDDVHFVRTTDESHVKAAQYFWKIVSENGYIYKKTYQAKYCVGCELEKTDSELVDGRCSIHTDKDLDLIDEENYFFKFSEFGQPLLDYYAQNKDFVVPDFRFNEIKSFIEMGLKDFSISRLKSKMPWGVPVPGDDEHVMYVWFDALVNYISTLGWPENSENFGRFWEEGQTVQICGKDNLRQQSAMWQAMLMASGITPTNKIIINGFLNGPDGQKMSKSIGNVISPNEVIEKYGTEALRFYLLHNIGSFEDSPISMDLIGEAYKAHLVNGIGNLTNRILKMKDSYEVEVSLPDVEDVWVDKENVSPVYHEAFKKFEMREALQYLMKEAQDMDAFIAKEEPFKKIKELPDEAKEDVARLVLNLWYVAVLLEPFMPMTSAQMKEAIALGKVPESPLFPRLD